MPSSSSSEEYNEPVHGTRKRKKQESKYFLSQKRSRSKRKKRRTSSSSDAEDVLRMYRKNRIKRSRLCHHRLTSPNDFFFKRERFSDGGEKSNSDSTRFYKRIENRDQDQTCENNLSITEIPPHESKCWINDLPEEIILKIFSYLSLGSLIHTIPQVCKRWEVLALDWSLWKSVENVTIKNMVISTVKLRALLRTIPNLKKLELILR